MNIAIDGTSGSGKGTLAKILAKKLHMDGPYSGGDIMRQMANDANASLEKFQKIAQNNAQFDLVLDQKMHQLSLKKNNAIFEGRLTAFFCKSLIRIYLDCPLSIRAKRVSYRDHKTLSETERDLNFRDKNNQKRYYHYYGITMGDPTQYNLFLNSENLSPDQLASLIINKISTPEYFVLSDGQEPHLVN